MLYDHQVGFKERKADLLKAVEERDPNNLGVFVVRSAMLKMSCVRPSKAQYKATLRCCELKPDFYEAHFQKFEYECGLEIIPSSSGYVLGLEKLIEQFPMDSRPIVALRRKLQEMGRMDQAERLLENALTKFPEEEFYVELALSREMHPSTVDLLKKAIAPKSSGNGPYITLFAYYVKKTREYGKALEVINRAYLYCTYQQFLEDIYIKRRNLLNQIIQQDFWNKL